MANQLKYKIVNGKDNSNIKGKKSLLFNTWTEADVALNKLGVKGSVIIQVKVDV